MKIEYANTKDLEDLVILENICFKQDRLNKKKYQHFLKSEKSWVIVVRENHAIIASSVMLFRRNSKIAKLYSLAVLPAFRKKGIALELMHFIEQALKKFYYHKIRLEVRIDNIAARKFYEKLGYSPFGEIEHFYEDGQTALRMEKEI